MRQKLYMGLNIAVMVLFVAMCVLTAFELSKSSELTREVNNLKEGATLAKQTDQLQSAIANEQQAHTQLTAQVNQLQNTYGELQTKVARVQQLREEARGKVAYLTFDDGPSNLTPHVLDVLKQNNIHATFFVIGKNATEYPDFIKRAYNEGNVIGNHTWSHDYKIDYTSDTDFLNDFNKNQTFLANLIGVAPQVCRFPGGTNNTVSQKYCPHVMQKIDADVKAMGIKPFDWNAYAGDAESGPKPSPDQIVHNVMKDAAGHKNAVILFHDTSVNGNDVQALPEIIKELKNDGYSFGVLTPQSPDCQFKPV